MKFLYPPRPTKKVQPDFLGFYESRGWEAQVKKDGHCHVISTGRRLSVWTRKGLRPTLWRPGVSVKPLERLKACHMIACEVLDHRTRRADTVYIFDLLVFEGRSLVGTTMAYRRALLLAMFPIEFEEDSHYGVTDRLWIAKNIQGDLRLAYDNLDDEDDEGLVLKDPAGVLGSMSTAKNNHGWQVKCLRQAKGAK